MKKNIFAIFALAIVSIFCFTACNSTPSITGEFKDEEYIVSIDETINFYDYLEVSGIEKSDVNLTSSNEDILKKQEDGTFVGVISGEAYIFANYQNRVLASVKVNVKYKQSMPKNFILNSEGVYSWDKSFVVVDGREVYASEYEIAYSLIEENSDPNRIEYTFAKTDVNYFTFDKIGSYYVKVKALSSNKYIDDSVYSAQVVVNYGVMGVLENITIENSETFGEGKATISWEEKVNASYDVYINGIKLFENLNQNYFEYDYSVFKANDEINITVISKDNQDLLISTKTVFSLNKLQSSSLKYNYTDGNGFVDWLKVDNALGYRLRTFSVNDSTDEYTDFSVDDDFSQYLKGKESGLYNFSLMTIGGKSDQGLFLNGEILDTLLVAKLSIPKIEITFGDKNATLKFSEDEYIKNYRIEWGNKSEIYNTDEGLETIIDLSDLSVGQYNFTITALPTEEEGEVKPFSDGELSTSYVINSDSYIFEFYILDEFTDITHSLNTEEKLSTIVVDKIENANYYSLYINDKIVDNNKYQVVDNGEKLSIILNDLSSFIPEDDKYILKVVAGRRNEENIDTAVKQEIVKELGILPIVSEVSSEEQENGSYKWNILEQNALYVYEIYKTEKDYVIEPNAKPVASGETTEGKINEILEFGYYVIRIVSKSIDNNNYLDSNYYNKENYFTANFIVTQKIETPNVRFENDNGTYKLIIESVEYGGGYDIYINGEKDGAVLFGDSHPEFAVYDKFEETFENPKDYQIKVIAHSGTMYDKFLHTPSDEFELTITKLAVPTFEVIEDYNENNNLKKEHEYLQVNMIENADYPVIKLENEVVNLDNQTRIDMIDYSTYDTEFKISLQYIAVKNSENNHYYLDSQLNEINFKRVSSPTSISYSDGVLTFANNENGKVENYFITLTTVNSVNSDYYTRFFTDDNSLTFDLQEKINQLLESDENFKNAYKMSEYLQVEISSHTNKMIENIYYLPSANGTTIQGQNKLDLKKLDAPEIKFDSSTHILSWNNVSDNTTYDIYVDDTKMVESYTSTSISLEELGDIDWLTSKIVYVKSYNKSFLDSDNSNSINIKKLQPVSSINVANVDGDWIISLSLLSDTGNISEIQVNGSADNVTFTPGGNVASFNIADFSGVNDFNFQVIYKNTGNANYYINSDVTSFTLVNLEDNVFQVTLSDDTLSWNTIASDFIGTDIDPLIYTIKIVNKEQEYYINLTDRSYSIQDIETKIGAKLSEEVQLQVIASINSDYVLTLKDGQAKGYYGQHIGQVINVEKLDEIDNISKTIEDNITEQTVLNQKLNSSVILKWKDLWSSLDNINFKVVINYQDGEPLSLILKNGDEHENYKLSLSDGEYILKLNKEIIKSGVNDISLTVLRTGSINSETKSISVERLQNVNLATISDSGILTIEDEQNCSYLIQISIEDRTIEKSFILGEDDFSKTINLMTENFLVGKLGSYTVKVIAFDNNMEKAPSKEEFVINGYKLEGIDNIQINDSGNIVLTLIIDDFSNLVFTAKFKTSNNEVIREFVPMQVEGSSNQFYVAMIDIIDLFKDILSMQAENLSFDFTVRKAGSIDADWVNVTFNYAIDSNPVMKREASIVNDYIIFAKKNNDNTVGFRAYIKGYEESYLKYFTAEETIGYWKESQDGTIKEFVREKDPSSSATYTECYGILISELLSDLSFGQVTFNISRIGKESQVYYQYNSYTFDIYKLNAITGDSFDVSNNVLSWEWIQQDENEEYAKSPTAYYVKFIIEDSIENKEFQIMSYKNFIDLSNIGLVPGESYNISIIAVSNNSNVICSNSSTRSFTIRKYNAPISVEVKNGKITFNEEKMRNSQFMQDIITFFNTYTSQSNWVEKGNGAEDVDKLYNTMVKDGKEYFEPINFRLDTILNSETRVSLQLTLINGGAATNTIYKISGIDAIKLFPDFEIDYLVSVDPNTHKNVYEKMSYVKLLGNYAEAITDSSAEFNTFNKFVTALSSSNKGIGDDQILFDDLGREIPSGEYYISVVHSGSGVNISSDASESYKMYLSYAPQMTLQNENIEGKSQYTINVKPVSTYNVEEIGSDGSPTLISKMIAQKYKMTFRIDNAGNKQLLFTLMISFNGNEWEISYNDEVLQAVEGKLPLITNVDNGEDIPGFKINMSSLKYSLNEKQDDLVKINQLMQVDIYAYLPSELGYTTNGKSAIFNVNYLDLPQENIKFENGVFSIIANLDKNYEVLVRYKLQGASQDSFKTSFIDGQALLNFKDAGAYDYIILSINGSISTNVMNIESDTYAIKNIYKLSEPELTTENNNLIIKYNTQNTNNMSTLSFMMGNDISLAEGYDGDDIGYYYISEMTRNDNGSAYYVGSTNADGTTIYKSELTATSFSAYFNGNSGSFTLSEDKFSYGDQSADHLLVFNEGKEKAILTSEVNVINARMLPTVTSANVEGGNYSWSEVEIDDTFSENGTIVYKIDVIYYEKDLNEIDYNKQKEETYYSISNTLASSYISEQYDYYKINVTTLVGIETNEENNNAVKSIEGKYYTFNKTVKYQDGAQVLRSQAKMGAKNDYIVRTISPVLYNNKGISQGKVEFMIDKNLYTTDQSNQETTSERITIIAEYERAGKNYSIKLTGSFEFAEDSNVGYENYKIVRFTPDEGQLNDISSFNLNIYIFGKDGSGKNQLNSKPLKVENVYKLGNVKSSYYEIGLEENGQTYIDFDEYFKQNSINNDYSCYKIVITIVDLEGKEQKTEMTSSTGHKFVFTDDMIDKIIKIQVQDGQSNDQLNKKLLLYSDTLSFNIYKTSAEDLSLSWNQEKVRFEWNWVNENNAQYEFWTNLLINGITEQGFTNNYYYMPKNSGTVQEFTLRARMLNLSDEGNEIYLFSDTLSFEGSADVMLFSGGTGEQNSPYLISDLEDFLNISKRNEEGQKFYFRLTTDLTISDGDLYDEETSQRIIDTFYGEFDGNGKTLTFISNSIYDMESYTNNIIPGFNSLTVNKYSSLFNKIGEGGKVKNLLINYEINYNKVSNNTIAFAPLALYNYGTIDNVILNDMEIYVAGNENNNNILIGGLVTLNYGTIQNCKNRDELDYTMTQNFAVKLGYGGIALFNTSSAIISNCFNSGTKSVKLTVENNIAVMAGITLSNQGKISVCGNDSNFVISSVGSFSVTGYVSGITMSNSYGTIEYVYNNGSFTRGTNFGKLNSAGIAYEITSGIINNIVETAGINYFVTCTGSLPTIRGTLYAKADSGVDGINTVALKETSINCGSTGYKLIITSIEGGFTAKIQ